MKLLTATVLITALLVLVPKEVAEVAAESEVVPEEMEATAVADGHCRLCYDILWWHVFSGLVCGSSGAENCYSCHGGSESDGCHGELAWGSCGDGHELCHPGEVIEVEAAIENGDLDARPCGGAPSGQEQIARRDFRVVGGRAEGP